MKDLGDIMNDFLRDGLFISLQSGFPNLIHFQ